MEILKKIRTIANISTSIFFLIDTSGSMQETKIDIANKVIRNLLDSHNFIKAYEWTNDKI